MGRFSIRLKITIWFTAALVVIVLFAYLMIFVVSRQILIKTIQDSLVETVENNVDEIEYFSGMDEIHTDADIDYLIDYRKGYLEIDDDFLSKVNEVYTGLYDEKSRLIYGENPIAAKVADLEFVDSEIQKVMKDGTGYYIFDRKLTADCTGSSAGSGRNSICRRIFYCWTYIKSNSENSWDCKKDWRRK